MSTPMSLPLAGTHPGVLEVFSEPILVVSASGTIETANSAAARVFGASRLVLRGRRLRDFLEGPAERFNEFLHLCLRSGQMMPGSLVVRGQQGDSWRAHGARYPTEDADRVRVVLRFTPRREGASAFRALNERMAALCGEVAGRRRVERELRAGERRKNEFLAMLAHELRNPLAPIRNAMQIMAVCEGNSAMTSTARGIVERQVRHLTRLIDDLLDISRITQGKIELRKERIAIGSVIQLAVEMARPHLEGRKHVLQLELPGDGLYLEADPNRLAQALAELLENAAKYSAAGASIRIEGLVADNEVLVRVIDRGIGISPDQLEDIFELFSQGEVPGNAPHEGLGVGLTLVRRIVELHGGTVTAESEGHGRGSLFTVRLPRAHPQSGILKNVVADDAQPSPCSLKILVADDNRDAALTLSMMLELEGHQVRAAHDGAEALAIADAFKPQLMLLDIGMPVLDGYQTARQVLQRPWSEDTYLVALTGWGQEADRQKAIAAGFSEHLVKPAAPELVSAVVARVATRRAQGNNRGSSANPGGPLNDSTQFCEAGG
jgi:signal transduction histidine kinase/ActR/RegA family two-component response regulator